MDQREAMALSGSASYYMQRGMPGLHGSPGIHPLSNPNVQFQSNNVGGSSIMSTLSIEPSSIISTDGINVGAPSAVPPGEPVRRKRGRPRKYGPDGTVSLAFSPSSATPAAKLTPIQKRSRARPPGTGQNQRLASHSQRLSGSAGVGFTLHVITIAIGEDITTKITSFSQQEPRAICVLSANGAISTATLRQPSTSGGTVTFEGRFEILCLSGSYFPIDNGAPCGRTGGLSVCLASPDGRVIGGGIGGVLIAATIVQVIVGSFLCGSSKTKNKAGEILESGDDSDRQTVDNTHTPASVQLNQKLSPTSSMGVWPGSRKVDVQNLHVDIDLSRG